MSRWSLYLAQCAAFGAHCLLVTAYRVLQFFSKRGSLLIVPVLTALAFLQFRAELHDHLEVVMQEFRPGHAPAPWVLDGLVVVTLTATLGFVVTRWFGFKNYILVVVLSGVILLQFRPELHAALMSLVMRYPLRLMPLPWMLDALMVALFVLAGSVYEQISYLLSVVLGTFPQPAWPLRPVRPLIVRARRIRSAVVTIAVPPLPRPWF